MAIRKWKMYLENCTQIVFLKRKATSDFYDKKRIETKSILPIASRKTKHEFLTQTPNVLYARKNRRQPFLRKWTYKGQAKKGAGRMPWH